MTTKICGIYLMMGILVLMGSTNLYTFIMQHRDPITYHRTWTTTPKVKVGGIVELHYDFTRLRMCRTDVSMIIEEEKTHQVVRRENFVGAARAAAHYLDIPINLQLPPPDKVGCYLETTVAVNYCNEGQHVIDAPPIRFCVVD
jgi:hypothetical protein